MKAISQLLLFEQIQLNRKPAVKIQIQKFGFPAESSKIMFNQYDWTPIAPGTAPAKTAGTAYAPNGDSCVVTGSITTNNASTSWGTRYIINLSATIIRSGVTSVVTFSTPCDTNKLSLGEMVTGMTQNNEWYTGWVYTAVAMESIDVVYDDDWFITYSLSQTKPGSTGGNGYPVTTGSIIYGLYGIILGNGINASANSFVNNREISLVDTKTNITSLSQVSNFSPSILTEEKATHEQNTNAILLSQPELLRTATIHPQAYLHKITGYPLILSLWSEGRVYLCELKRGTTIMTATFDKAYTFYNSEPVKISSDSTYIYAFGYSTSFRSPLPGFWTVPTIGTGPGDYIELGE